MLMPVLTVVAMAPFLAGTPSDSISRDTIYLEPVIVNADRAPGISAVSPFEHELIEGGVIYRAKTGITTEETLRQVPGIFVSDRNSLEKGDRLSVRGIGSRASFGIRGVKVLVDDIPLTMPDGQTQLNNLDLGSAGHIDLFPGPASSLYGNAAGGVIDIRTESPVGGLSFKPSIAMGSFGYKRWQLKFGAGYQRLSALFNIRRITNNGYVRHSASSFSSFNLVSGYKLSDNSDLTAVSSFVDAPYLLNPSSLTKSAAESAPTETRPYVISQGAGEKVRHFQGGLTLHTGHKGAYDAMITVFGLSRDVLNPIPGRIVDLSRVAGGLRSTYSRPLSISRGLVWTVGLDIEAQKDSRQEYKNLGLPDIPDPPENGDLFKLLGYGDLLIDQDETVTSFGPFLKAEIPLRPSYHVTAALRYDHFIFRADDAFFGDGADDSATRTMSSISPMIGVARLLSGSAKVYVNLSTAFQTPTTSELGNRDDGAGGFNPRLGPEKIRSFEIGTDGVFLSGKVSLSAALFFLDLDRMLIQYQAPESATDEVYFRNAGRAHNLGAEFTAHLRPYESIRFNIAYSRNRFTFADYVVNAETGDTSGFYQLKGNEVPGVVPHRLYAGFSWNHSRGYFIEFDWQYVGRYSSNDFNGPPPGTIAPLRNYFNGSYQRTDVRLGAGKWSRFEISPCLAINNLFDSRYCGSVVPNASGERYFEPSPGRAWLAGIEISF